MESLWLSWDRPVPVSPRSCTYSAVLIRRLAGTYALDGEDASKLTGDQLADIRKAQDRLRVSIIQSPSRTTVLRNVMLPLTYANVPLEQREAKAQKSHFLPPGLMNHVFIINRISFLEVKCNASLSLARS